jgi:hypothetical protein
MLTNLSLLSLLSSSLWQQPSEIPSSVSESTLFPLRFTADCLHFDAAGLFPFPTGVARRIFDALFASLRLFFAQLFFFFSCCKPAGDLVLFVSGHMRAVVRTRSMFANLAFMASHATAGRKSSCPSLKPPLSANFSAAGAF